MYVRLLHIWKYTGDERILPIIEKLNWTNNHDECKHKENLFAEIWESIQLIPIKGACTHSTILFLFSVLLKSGGIDGSVSSTSNMTDLSFEIEVAYSCHIIFNKSHPLLHYIFLVLLKLD